MSIERRPGNIPVPHRPMNLGLDMTPPRKMQQPPMETKTDYGKYRFDFDLFYFAIYSCKIRKENQVLNSIGIRNLRIFSS